MNKKPINQSFTKPQKENITKARAAVLMNRFIDYMRDDIRQDYRENIINY